MGDASGKVLICSVGMYRRQECFGIEWFGCYENRSLCYRIKINDWATSTSALTWFHVHVLDTIQSFELRSAYKLVRTWHNRQCREDHPRHLHYCWSTHQQLNLLIHGQHPPTFCRPDRLVFAKKKWYMEGFTWGSSLRCYKLWAM
jgi:hypothetical protein